MKNVTIRPVLNGWICRVGCSEVVFTDRKAMLLDLDAYIKNPQAVEKTYLDNAVNKEVLPPTEEDRPDRGIGSEPPLAAAS